MKKRSFWMLGLAALFAVAAVFLAQDWLNERTAASVAEQKVQMANVVVASTPLEYGGVIRKEHLRVMQWPKESVPDSVFGSVDELVKEGTERVVLRRIEANEPIFKSKVSGFGERASLSTLIESDMRAATIRVNDVNGVAGFVLPGDRVDILITRSKEDGKKTSRGANLITDVLLQNVKVLAIDQVTDEVRDKPTVAKAVTLEVTAHQTQKLVLAQSVGSLSLALRNVGDANAAASKTVSISDLRATEGNDLWAGGKQRTKKPVSQPVAVVAPVKPVVATATPVEVAKVGMVQPLNVESSVNIVRGTESREYKVLKDRQSLPELTGSATGNDVGLN